MYLHIEIDSHFNGKLQLIHLNEPETFNSLNKDMLREIRQFVRECDQNDEVRCIAITGRGKAFCSGQNLREALEMGKNKHEERIIQRIVIDYYNPLVREITHCRKPVVALVNGPAVGAGAMLALICDFAIAKESAYFSQAFVNIGLIPDTGGTYFLPKLLGRQLANYLTFTGKKLSAPEAKNLGLIAEVFSEDEFLPKSMEILENLTNAPTLAIGLTKKAFNKSYSNDLKEQLDLESIYQQDAAETKDFAEGVAAFLEKRKPQYTGK